MRYLRSLVLGGSLAFTGAYVVRAGDGVPKPVVQAPESALIVKPYLQLGYAPARGTVRLLWHAADTEIDWYVEYRARNDRPWTKVEAPSFRRVAVAGVEPHRVYGVSLLNLEAGSTFTYKLKAAGAEVFTADARAPKSPDQPYRFVVFGDCAAGSAEQKPIAYQASLAKPDFLVIPGDVVYERGRVSEYRRLFWPVYNADVASPAGGGPLLRSSILLAAAGNHDTDGRDLDKSPDGLAYFYYWEQPLNGPIGKEGGPFAPALLASEANRRAFADAAAEAFPRMANFSFDYASAHWTIIDSNPYVDWTDRELKEWVKQDLASAQNATWRFVAFHHPGFSSSREHFEQQQMRLLAPVFEAGKVTIVFSGHVHNYQRSYPMHFVPDKSSTLLVGGRDLKTPRGRVVNGRWTLDKSFDGRTDTTPDGVIYVVTGAGGQHLYNPEQQDDRDSWLGFTHKFISKVHSLTVADVSGSTLTVRQLSGEGEELDRFVLTK
jgi:3',5'-cyclic AMP phosphodiesterase CpdA